MRWNRANSGRCQVGTGHGAGVGGAGWSTIRRPVAAGSHGCSIRVFREGKSEIPDKCRPVVSFLVNGVKMVNLDSTTTMLQDKRRELIDQLDAIDRAIAALKGTTVASCTQEQKPQARHTAPVKTPSEVLPTVVKPQRILSDAHKQKLIEGRRRAREAKDVARGVARQPLGDEFVPALAQSTDQLPRLVKQNHNRELTIEPLTEEISPTPKEAFVN